jgi:hypothetical protein
MLGKQHQQQFVSQTIQKQQQPKFNNTNEELNGLERNNNVSPCLTSSPQATTPSNHLNHSSGATRMRTQKTSTAAAAAVSTRSSQRKSVKYFSLNSLITNYPSTDDVAMLAAANQSRSKHAAAAAAAVTTDSALNKISDTIENSLNSFSTYSNLNLNENNSNSNEPTASKKLENSLTEDNLFKSAGEIARNRRNFQKYLLERHVKHFSNNHHHHHRSKKSQTTETANEDKNSSSNEVAGIITTEPATLVEAVGANSSRDKINVKYESIRRSLEKNTPVSCLC